MKANRFFLHEHPHAATSWGMEEMKKMIATEGVEITTCDMCAYGMKSSDAEGEGQRRKGLS